MARNRSIPDAIVIPELAYADVIVAAEWLCDRFGFTERLRIGRHRVQLELGAGAIVVTELAPGAAAAAVPTHAVMVRVADVDRHHEHAVTRGVTVLRAPASHPYGERQYSAEDLGGHRWTFTQAIADVDPATWGGVVPGKTKPVR